LSACFVEGDRKFGLFTGQRGLLADAYARTGDMGPQRSPVWEVNAIFDDAGNALQLRKLLKLAKRRMKRVNGCRRYWPISVT